MTVNQNRVFEVFLLHKLSCLVKGNIERKKDQEVCKDVYFEQQRKHSQHLKSEMLLFFYSTLLLFRISQSGDGDK